MAEVKICGITCEEEIQYLNILRPEYAGFVFAESKRKIKSEQASYLLSILDEGIKSIGVFRNNPIEEIIDVLNKVKLYGIQLHGNEDFDFIERLKDKTGSRIKIWKALSIKDEKNIIKFMERKHEYIDRYLIDGSNPGSGKEYNLDLLKKIIKQYNLENKFILAGGINPENASIKIKEVMPYAVDVSSGVEIIENNNRIKSFKKMKKLILEVKRGSL